MASRTHVQRVRVLYKTILRLHRGLPAEIRPLGDNYVRDEFRRHSKCVESEAIVFLHEWTVSSRETSVRERAKRLCSLLPMRRREVGRERSIGKT